MCGILGSVGLELDAARARAALASLAHRGPDGSGLWLSDGAGRDARESGPPVMLGHTRLSIIDLSEAGAQPMENEDGTLRLAFNGEIYNHEELRAELSARGHRFRSRCDAEVVLHLYEERGPELVHELVGMFAFALWDARGRTLLLARDRLGIKPLFWYEAPGVLAFASEPKGLAALPGLDLEPDPTALVDFLTYQFVPAPKSLWRRVRKLPAGTLLVHREGRTEERRYWELPRGEERGWSEARALEELEARLERAVADHLVADVELGVFLSAGVDSSLVAALANARAERPLTAFTVAFPERADDEAGEAAAIASALGSPHRTVRFDGEAVRRGVELLPEVFDEPFADPASLPMLALSELAARERKVVLSGDGGDELFLGYGRYAKPARRRHAWALADALSPLVRPLAQGPLHRVGWLRDAGESELGRWVRLYGGIPRETKRRFLDLGAGELAGYDDYWFLREHAGGQGSARARMQRLDFAGHLPEQMLAKVDRTAMRHGLEVRPPLLDHRVVELAARLPPAVARAGGEPKGLLRRALARRLPPELAARVASARKRGFSVPLRALMASGDRFRLSGDVDLLGALRVDRGRAERALSRERDSHALWLLYVLERFVRTLAPAPAT